VARGARASAKTLRQPTTQAQAQNCLSCALQLMATLLRPLHPLAWMFNRESIPGLIPFISSSGFRQDHPRLPAPLLAKQWLSVDGTTDYSGATASELHGLPFDEQAVWRSCHPTPVKERGHVGSALGKGQ